jgi:type II secretory pathway predicted ATPase ExeA
MYRQHFGLKHAPLGKESLSLWPHPQLSNLEKEFGWLLKSPGLGLLTAEPGLGKTAALRQITKTLNPHEYQVLYIAETDFGRLDFYRQLALKLNLSSSYRRSQLWRDIKEHITHLATQKNILLVLIIDEAQNLPSDFLKDFPSFLNFVFDSKDYLTVWLVGHPELARTLGRANHAALASRIQARCDFDPINDREAFKELVCHGFTQAGCTQTLLSDPGIEILRMASKGNPRQVHRLLVKALQLATEKKQNHLSDDIVKEAIEILQRQ